jgi:hypothetical protein
MLKGMNQVSTNISQVCPEKQPPILALHLKDAIAEDSSDDISTVYWVKVGIPRAYLPKLKALGNVLGLPKARVSSAIRVAALMAALHPEDVKAWASDLRAQAACLVERDYGRFYGDPEMN